MGRNVPIVSPQIQHLMANYDRSVRPSRNAADSLNITFGLALTQIIDVVSAAVAFASAPILHCPVAALSNRSESGRERERERPTPFLPFLCGARFFLSGSRGSAEVGGARDLGRGMLIDSMSAGRSRVCARRGRQDGVAVALALSLSHPTTT